MRGINERLIKDKRNVFLILRKNREKKERKNSREEIKETRRRV